MRKEKIGFFSRVKLAVTKIEDYNVFVNEKLSIGIKYFLLIILSSALILSLIETFDFYKKYNKVTQYIKNELPEFNYYDGNLEFSENIEASDKEFDFCLITDTSNVFSDEKASELSNKIELQGIIFFKDKAVMVNSGNSMIIDYIQLQEQIGIKEFNNNLLVVKIDSISIFEIIVFYFIIVLLGLFILELISVFTDCIVLSVLAFSTVRITKTNLNYKQSLNISIYSLTLPIILYMIYCIANYFYGFYTQYFKLLNSLISYVYIVAAIFIIKSDYMKQKAMIGKIVEEKIESKNEEKEVEDDKNREKDKKKDDKSKEENDEDKMVDGEPDGSEI